MGTYRGQIVTRRRKWGVRDVGDVGGVFAMNHPTLLDFLIALPYLFIRALVMSILFVGALYVVGRVLG